MCQRLSWEELDPGYLQQLIGLAKAEDLQGAGLRTVSRHPGDPTTALLAEGRSGVARIRARVPQVVCGLGLIPHILQVYGGGVEFSAAAADGDAVAAGTVLGTVSGSVEILLRAERPMLNFLQHLGGVATWTARHVECLGTSRTRLLDTRKTTPGFRMLEKYAVACGGAWNHRLGLFDRVMLKDNHLAAAAGGLADMVTRSREQHPELVVQVEVDDLAQLTEALKAGPDIVLLDNFDPADLPRAVAMAGDSVYTEASGGVTLDTLGSLSGIGLDFISCGALVHQSRWVDIGLDFSPAEL